MHSADPVLAVSGDDIEWPEQDRAFSSLESLGDELTRAGYGEFLACFDPLIRSRSIWRAARACVAPTLGPLIDLFLLGEAVSPAVLPSGVGDLVPGLTGVGLLNVQADELVETVGVVILLVRGSWLICDPPQPDPLFYLGEDSLALLDRLTPCSARTCLDLCAGPGIHAVHCARYVQSVIAVEVDPRIARLTQLNARLNGVAGRVEVLSGDLYEPVAGRRFDLISANPSTLPYPVDLPGPRIGHGGEDGLHMTSRVLSGLPGALTDRGCAHLVGMSLTDGKSGGLGDWLATVAREKGLGIRCSVISHSALSEGGGLFEILVSKAAAIAACDRDRVRESYVHVLDSLQASHLSAFFLQVVLGSGQLDLTDVSKPGRNEIWHV